MRALISMLFIFQLSTLLMGQKKSAEKIYQKQNRAVVTIQTFHEDKSSHGQASGVIIKSKGWVVTNYHVLGDANFLYAEHEGKEILLDSVLAIDIKKDIMIFQLHDAKNYENFKKIPNIKLGNSDKLKVGQKIFAIGSPLGFENTITEGIISGLRAASDSTQSFIQISAPISPGSSGGAVFNTYGELIGISNMIISGENAQNLNFAILINDVIATAKNPNHSISMILNQPLDNYFQMGYNEFLNKNFLLSIIYYQKVKSTGIEVDVPLFYSIALSYENLNNLDSAEYYYKKSLAAHVTVETYIGLGNIYFARMQFDRAISYYNEAMKLDPSFYEPYSKISKAYFSMGDNKKSREYFERAYLLNPDLRNQEK
jgi:Trypsin-like peptidase domain/Tetratricopeptide repeat